MKGRSFLSFAPPTTTIPHPPTPTSPYEASAAHLDVPVRQEKRSQMNSSCCLLKRDRKIDGSGFVRNLLSLFPLPLSLAVITKLN